MAKRKMVMMHGAWVACAAISAGLLFTGGKEPMASAASEAGSISNSATRPYSPPVRFANEDMNLYWGNTHLHTNNSMDAISLGGATTTPEEAFRFAMGEQIVAASGVPAKLRHPLDFLVVSDHGEYLGVLPKLAKADSAKVDWQPGQQWSEFLHSGDPKKLAEIYTQFHQRVSVPAEFTQSIWQEVAKTADRFNNPGHFTAFIGYEWSSTPNGDNLHRNVIFRDGAAKATQVTPFSALDSTDAEKLWAYLRAYEAKTGGQVLAIPHNGNISNGRMFAPETFTGQPLTAAYARERARWEPVVEVTQMKGTSEAHSTLSPTDEFADFEIWDLGNFTQTAKQPWMLPYEYARSALKSGLQYEQKLGVNPFKFGMVGGTDQHNGLTTTSEDNFIGQFRNSEPSAGRYSRAMAPVKNVRENWRLGAAGLTAVWAKENTRAAIFDAMKRREVYATTGSRIQVRVFGGWNFAKSDVLRPDYAHIGYEKGVPMGGDLMRQAGAKAPSFMIAAAKDPDDANLDRVQVIKGWLDAKGQAHEKIYDVALSGGRKVNPRTGKAPPVGNTVDIANATFTNSIGAPELATVWTDPAFDPNQRAFYYVRVLEIPKPRWTAYDAKFYGVHMPANIPMTVQDRAFSSPIWYNPEK